MDTFDKATRLLIPHEDLEQASFKKTLDEKIARRVGNEAADPLYVINVDAPVAEELDFYIVDNVEEVLKEIVTEIVRYSVPPAKFFNLDQIIVSGDNIAKYIVKIAGSTNKTKRTYYGGSLNESFRYNSYRVNAGEVITVDVIHYSDMVADFEATIEGRVSNE